MSLVDVLTGIVYLNVAVFVGTIIVANLYAILHAWQSKRVVWCVALMALLLAGAGIGTAAYLFLHTTSRCPEGSSGGIGRSPERCRPGP